MYGLHPIPWLIITALTFYQYIVIAAAIVSTLLSFGVLDRRNRFVYMVDDFLERATYPALRPIRNAMPQLGGIDFSPLVLIILLEFAIRLTGWYIAPLFR